MDTTKIYDLRQTFEENVTYGPFWEGELPSIVLSKSQHQFLGYEVNSRFGVPACPLTVNSRTISLLSRLGYDIITYKSVRTIEWRGNVFPHWLHVDAAGQLTEPHNSKPLIAAFEAFANDELTMANSFGIHSIRPEHWQPDVNHAKASLQSGQVLILSLMPSPVPGMSLVEDVRRLADLAAQTQADAFEVNLACPNTDGGKGLIYDDLKLSHRILVTAKIMVGKRPLLVKVGYYNEQRRIKEFLEQNRDVIEGVSSTNTYSMVIRTKQGKEAFPGRPSAGVSGAGIRTLSMKQAKNLIKYKQELGLDALHIIGIGGVTNSDQIDDYLSLGVNAVQSAVGVWADPYLASKYKEAHV
jgi:dihydroorotate dehydrogenase (NAD+) catalytic subunit